MKIIVVFDIPEIEIKAENTHSSLVLKSLQDFLSRLTYKWRIWKIVNNGDKEDVFN